MNLSMDSLYESSIKLLDYLTHLYRFNNFLVDNVDDNKVKALKNAIMNEDRVKAVRLYLELDRDCDMIRSSYCSKRADLPYRSDFHAIAKDLYRELKRRNLINHDDVKLVAYILRFISTSEYWQIRDLLVKRSLSWYMYCDIPINPNDFYCNYIPLEAILDYCIKIAILYIKWR